MSMQDFMQELMRAQKVSKIHIVPDASISSLPDEIEMLSGCSQHSGMTLASDHSGLRTPSSQRRLLLVDYSCGNSSQHSRSSSFSSPDSLSGFRERHRRIKETLSPVKVYRYSPSKNHHRHDDASRSTPTQLMLLQSQSSSDEEDYHHGGRGSLRSRLTRLASDSSIIIDGPLDV